MKNNILVYLALIVCSVVACDVDEYVKASNADEDRVLSQIDFSNSDIKMLYDDYNMGLLFEYDQILDFAYDAGSEDRTSLWGSIDMPQIQTKFEVDSVLTAEGKVEYEAYKQEVTTFLVENLFNYFKPNTTIATLMPYKVLVSNSLFSERNVPDDAGDVLTESEERLSSSARYNLRTVFNKHSIVFSIDLDELTTSSRKEEFTKDNFYILLSRIMGMHNLYDQVPEEFYGDKADYYGLEMEEPFITETGKEDYERIDFIDKDWFYEKGFIDARYFYGSSSGLGNYTQRYDQETGERFSSSSEYVYHKKTLLPYYDFVASKEYDVRAYVNELIFRDADELLAFPQNIQDNLKIIFDLLTEWGVDILAINPDLEVLNQ
ncbi:hypothetical protein NO995_02595 [Aestuariibaculum sp. M13]|uniref:hypothetical protein n=1 Tax=Aestuariibaculum sp. M13 TaxID=2967132 RepID=UPI002159F051|nr:hypothetical protein [Aestuariibaculum sp. M13]MCR8666554.1 hypothetical protein [Aestuariibaculum sp. M13]